MIPWPFLPPALLRLERIREVEHPAAFRVADFVRRYLDETRTFILPYAAAINPDMFRELSDLVASRQQFLTLIEGT